MIIRIMGEGQLRVDEAAVAELNKLDASLEAAVDLIGNSTELVVIMHLDVLGKLASLGAAPMRRRADQIFDEFISCVSARLTGPANH